MPYFTYILYSESKDQYYIGSCEELTTRIKRHNDGATPSTKIGRPWKVVWFNEHGSRTDALQQENHIKKMKSRIYIEKLILSFKSKIY
jgi:putative endonuclease